MDTVTRTFPVDLSSSYTAGSIIELCHFRDMVFDADERVGIYLESFFCNLNLKSFNLGVIADFDGSESEVEKMAKFSAAEAKSQKVGLRILTRKNNTGNWRERAEIILVNRGRKDYFDLLIPYLAKNQVKILEKNDALAIQLIDYGYGLLKEGDSLLVETGITVTISKKNDLEAFEARLATLETAVRNRLIDLPESTLLGRNTGVGVVEAIPQTNFVTPSQSDLAIQQAIEQAIFDLVGLAPLALNSMAELSNAVGNDPDFAATILAALAERVKNTGNESIGGIKTFTGSQLRMSSNAPGFWLNEIDNLYGVYLGLDGNILQIQRRDTNFGSTATHILQINLTTFAVNFIQPTTTIKINSQKVLGARETGWTVGTGTPNKGTFAADTATTLQVAQRVIALEQMARNMGFIN